MWQSLVLIGALSSACCEKTNKKKKCSVGFFFWGGTCLTGCTVWDFCGCYVQLKAVLRISAWILCAPNLLLFWLEAIGITKCTSHISRWILESWSLGFLIPYPNCHLGSFVDLNILSFLCIFSALIIICLWVFLFWSCLFGVLKAFCTWMNLSFLRLGKLFAIVLWIYFLCFYFLFFYNHDS
jgi:hypothetical protein